MAATSYQFVKAETFSVGDAAPVTTQAAIAAPTDLASAIVAINAIITVLEQFGLVEAN